MANFKTQVEGLTGLSVGTTPTNDEVSQFLVDGTTEVANRIIVLNPADMSKFCETTNSTTSVTKTGRILSVMREHDSTTILRSCVQISPENRYDATDSDSLNYRSKFNPAFYELDGVIHAIPVAATSDNDIVVTQVYYATNTGWSSTTIENFPYEYQYLVVLYASVKSLQNALSNKDSDLPSDLTEPIFPVVPGLISSVISESSITAPTFIPPIMGELDFSDTNNWISSEEDSEMLAARVNEISTKIQEHQARLQESVSIFQKDNTIFQKDLQIAITNAQLESENDSQKIQAYAQEVQNYATKYQHQVTDYINKLQKVQASYEWMVGRLTMLQQQYDASFSIMAPKQQQQGEQ